MFISAAAELDDRPGPLRDYLVSAQLEVLETASRAARISIEEGHFRADLDTDQFAHDLYSIILAFHYFHRLLADPKASSRARTSFDQLLTRSRSHP